MSAALLSIKNLVKTYPNGVQALRKVSLEVQKGEFVVIIGLSGSGKSTLLRCLNLLQRPTTGEIHFNGEDILHLKDERELRRNIAMIFQHFNLVPRLSVLGNALTGALGRTATARSLLGLYSASDRERARECLELVGIAEKSAMRADQLSGGQMQRVAIARALVQGPQILLADEPVAALDPSTCHTVMDYLRRVNRELGITIICNLHFLSLVREYASRVVALKAGEIVFDGPPSEISQQWFRRIYGDDAKEVHIQ